MAGSLSENDKRNLYLLVQHKILDQLRVCRDNYPILLDGANDTWAG